MARGPGPQRIEIPRTVHRDLRVLAGRRRSPHGLVQRARIVLLARRGQAAPAIAAQVGCSTRNVRKWKARFIADPRLRSLQDAERSGRPSQIPIWVRCELVRIACDRPDGKAAPFREIWTYGALADALEARTKRRISVSEVGRILRFAELRPHRVKQWLKCSDPDFTEKAKQVCDLYRNPPEGAVVVSIDEKPLQVLERVSETHLARNDASVRYEFEYKRHGTQALLAAFDVRTGAVFGRVVPHRTADALVAFMDALAARYPERQVYVVWDNLNIHYDGKDRRWRRFNKRHGNRFRFVYTPKHASWMNQIEIWFSILHRRVLKYGSFADPTEQRDQVEAFIRHWNRRERHPFRWTWRADRAKNGRGRVRGRRRRDAEALSRPPSRRRR